MTTDQLKSFIEEQIAFLQALDKVLPNKVDEDLISFLQGVQQHPWQLELLVKVLGKK